MNDKLGMKQDQIKFIIGKSIEELYHIDSKILTKTYNIHERTITHRLAMYMEPYFINKGYNVDIEYNRMRDEYGYDDIGNVLGKKLDFEEAGEGPSYVYPDIIVHKRDTSQNLIVIEVKMAWKDRLKKFDYKKINEYMRQLNYKYGIYIELGETIGECLIEYGPFE